MRKQIEKIIQESFRDYGLVQSELKSQVLSPRNAIDKAKFFNSESFQKNWTYTKSNLIKTKILDYSMAKDIGLVMAIFSRETGPVSYRYYKCMSKNQIEKRYVTSGPDVHKHGIAGFDFVLSVGGGQKKFHKGNFTAAGIDWEKVDPLEFRQGKTIQNPARMAVKDFLLVGFSMIAFSNKRLIEEIEGFESLSTEAKRTWLALFFAGSGYAKHFQKFIENRCKSVKKPVDYNLITDRVTKSSSNWKNVNTRLKKARQISLKAEIFTDILEMDWLDINDFPFFKDGLGFLKSRRWGKIN